MMFEYFNIRMLIISIVSGGVIYIFINSKKVKEIINQIKINNKLKKIIIANNIDIEEAKEILFLEEIVKALEIDIAYWQINRNVMIKRGDQVSFIDSEVGLVQGTFLGIKKSELLGYDDIYVVRDVKKSTIRQASISYVKEETVNVYK